MQQLVELSSAESLLIRDEGAGVAGNQSVGRDRFRSPDSGVEDVEIWEAFRQGLEELSDTHRKVLEMRELHGLKYSEMAKEMGCSKGTVPGLLVNCASQEYFKSIRPAELPEGEQPIG